MHNSKSIKHHLFTLQRISHLIRKKGTGTPKALARRVEISERSVYRYLKSLRLLGAVIKYCSKRQSYYYVNDFRIDF